MALGTLANVLVTSIRRRRRDLATLAALEKKYPGRLRFVFMNDPLPFHHDVHLNQACRHADLGAQHKPCEQEKAAMHRV